MVRGTASISQIEYCHFITPSVLAVRDTKRLHQEDGTQGNLLGPYSVPEKSDPMVWKVMHKKKPALYDKGMRDPGGLPGVTESTAVKSSAPTDMVPFTYYSRNPKLYGEFGHSYCIKNWLDLTCNDGILGLVTVKNGGANCGVCFSDARMEELTEFSVGEVF